MVLCQKLEDTPRQKCLKRQHKAIFTHMFKTVFSDFYPSYDDDISIFKAIFRLSFFQWMSFHVLSRRSEDLRSQENGLFYGCVKVTQKRLFESEKYKSKADSGVRFFTVNRNGVCRTFSMCRTVIIQSALDRSDPGEHFRSHNTGITCVENFLDGSEVKNLAEKQSKWQNILTVAHASFW